LLPILLIVAAAFLLLFVFRVGGARRKVLIDRWPALLFAGAALFLLVRGAFWSALALSTWAMFLWSAWPWFVRREFTRTPESDPADAEARGVLGVGPTATSSEIRAAYRAKMSRAHPDKGGSNAEAARLTAARDRLLRPKR
jgi:hypothetical protein